MIPLSFPLVVAVKDDELDILVAVLYSDHVVVLADGFGLGYAIWGLGGMPPWSLQRAMGYWEAPSSLDLGPGPSG